MFICLFVLVLLSSSEVVLLLLEPFCAFLGYEEEKSGFGWEWSSLGLLGAPLLPKSVVTNAF